MYVRRVLIQDKFDDIVPKYLNFIKGIVDSDDLPLNVNRETLQQSKIMKTISKKVTKKIIDMMIDLAKNKQDKYKDIWKYYGKNIKMGLIEDSQNQEKLLKLVRFRSSKELTNIISFDQYLSNFFNLDRTKENQDKIYYMGGENKDKIMQSPIIQSLIQKDYEVLLFDEPIDEYAFQRISKYEDKELVNVAKGDFKVKNSISYPKTIAKEKSSKLSKRPSPPSSNGGWV